MYFKEGHGCTYSRAYFPWRGVSMHWNAVGEALFRFLYLLFLYLPFSD